MKGQPLFATPATVTIPVPAPSTLPRAPRDYTSAPCAVPKVLKSEPRRLSFHLRARSSSSPSTTQPFRPPPPHFPTPAVRSVSFCSSLNTPTLFHHVPAPARRHCALSRSSQRTLARASVSSFTTKATTSAASPASSRLNLDALLSAPRADSSLLTSGAPYKRKSVPIRTGPAATTRPPAFATTFPPRTRALALTTPLFSSLHLASASALAKRSTAFLSATYSSPANGTVAGRKLMPSAADQHHHPLPPAANSSSFSLSARSYAQRQAPSSSSSSSKASPFAAPARPSIPSSSSSSFVHSDRRAYATSQPQQSSQLQNNQNSGSGIPLKDRISKRPSDNDSNSNREGNNKRPRSEDMSSGNRRRPGGHRRPQAPRAKDLPKELPGPYHSRDFIIHSFPGVTLKEQWNENPKAPLSNYLASGLGGAQSEGNPYTFKDGVIEGKNMVRATIVANETLNILGVGDATNRKEAEKLAALHAVYQLSSSGLLLDRKGQQAQAAAAAEAAGITLPEGALTPATANESTKLSDGTEISHDRARQFMEYYCVRFKFGKPEIEFSSSTTPKPVHNRKRKSAPGSLWEAVMSVGGRKIGMGAATSKKAAQMRAYLDVTKYLESCDPQLWADFADFTKKDPYGNANFGQAPHLVFQISDGLNEDIQGLCGDIRNSLLCYNAPQPDQAMQGSSQAPGWNSGRRWIAGVTELKHKSSLLQDKLLDYQTDPKMASMRATRASLPVYTRSSEILAKIEVNDVTIIMAATGSGKTTQVPQIIFDDFINRGDGAKCNIVCTQPRRLAATSVAERVADERGDTLGNQVGYHVRFDAKPPQPNGSITFCTTGIFLKRMQSALGANANPDSVTAMDQVSHIVVDEVHERDIDTDLLLVVLKRLIADRKTRKKPLKVILMSATIDPGLFQSYFIDDYGRPAPVAEVPGRTFPVQRHFLDDFVHDLTSLPGPMGGWVFNDDKVRKYLDKELSTNPANFVTTLAGSELEIPYPLVALIIAHVLRKTDDGHVLVFLPGWDEIKKVSEILLGSSGGQSLYGFNFNDSSKYSIHYLHSTIPAAEQREVFTPPPAGVRRIILATNIAETSVTIPDVVYVVDSGRVKENRYDPERHMSSLVSAWVGSSNIGQRAGRAGRHRPGEYYGIVSKRRLESLATHQLVEMKRADLSNVVMHVKALNLGAVEQVLGETIEPPGLDRIFAALETLHMLGALDSNKNLTPLGRVLLQLPTDPAIGKLMLLGSFFRCLDSALTLAAVMSSRDPFLAPLALKEEADRIKDSWSPVAFRSDPLAIVSAYNTWVAMADRGEWNSANRFSSDNFLSKQSLMAIRQVKGSLLQSLDQAGVLAVSAGGTVGPIFRRQTEVPPQLRENDHSLPLLAALIAMTAAPNFAIRVSEKACRTAQDKMVFIASSSVNARRREVGGPEHPSASFNPAEKRLYAFGEKTRFVPAGGGPNHGITQLRSVTRLDPLTYMLFGAYDLAVTSRGLEADQWLPITGDLHALDDVQRLKTLLDRCMLRVYEGVGKALTRERDVRHVASRAAVDTRHGSSRIRDRGGNLDEEKENESEDEEEDGEIMARASGTARFQHELAQRNTRKVVPLTPDEVNELQMLTTDVVRIIEAYANEREGTNSTFSSRPVTPINANPNVYRPPPARGPQRW